MGIPNPKSNDKTARIGLLNWENILRALNKLKSASLLLKRTGDVLIEKMFETLVMECASKRNTTHQMYGAFLLVPNFAKELNSSTFESKLLIIFIRRFELMLF